MVDFNRRNSAAAKLTLAEVQQMRQMYAEGVTQGSLAKHFLISVGQVGKIVRGESWVQGAAAGPSPAQLQNTLQRLLEVQKTVAESPPDAAASKPRNPMDDFINVDLAKERGYLK